MAGQSRPLVSVIVPAWNAEATLSETLASVAEQTYRQIEIIIVDDGSTDRTAEIAARFCSTEPRARLVAKPNGGLSSARNRGLANAVGQWVAPIDADDMWHPTKLEKQVQAALGAQAPPGFVYCWHRDIDEQGFVLGSGPRWAFEGAAFKRLAYQNIIHTVLLSREAVDRVGGYDETLSACEDVMIHLRISRVYPVACVPEHLLGYRKRPGSMSRDTDLVVRSWRAVHRALVADGADLPPNLSRWTEGFFAMVFAQRSAAEGSIGRAFAQLLRALSKDPLRWGAYLLYRVVRTAVRIARGRRPRPTRLHFSEADPRQDIPFDPDELPRLAKLLRTIDERRLARLARAERLEVRDRAGVRSARSHSG